MTLMEPCFHSAFKMQIGVPLLAWLAQSLEKRPGFSVHWFTKFYFSSRHGLQLTG